MRVLNNIILYLFLYSQLWRPLLTKIFIGLIVVDLLLLVLIAVFAPASFARALAIMAAGK